MKISHGYVRRGILGYTSLSLLDVVLGHDLQHASATRTTEDALSARPYVGGDYVDEHEKKFALSGMVLIQECGDVALRYSFEEGRGRSKKKVVPA